MDVGSLGKAKVIAHLIELGYDVYLEFDGKSPFDLVVHKDDLLERVEVKTTGRRTKFNTGWEVQLKKVRPNRTSNKIINFDNSKVDKVVVYIEPIRKVVLYDAKDIKAKTAMAVLDKDL